MPPKPEQPEQVRLDSLAPQQLVELRTTLNNEIQRLGEGGATLMRAATTFSSSKKAVEQLAASKTGVSHWGPPPHCSLHSACPCKACNTLCV